MLMIRATLLISAIGIVENVEKAVSMDIKRPDSRIYCLGKTYDEMGGSHYFKVNNYKGGDVPKVNPEKGKKLMKKLSMAIQKELVLSCHDCSEGGITVAVAEMAFAGNIGIDMSVCNIVRDKKIKNNAVKGKAKRTGRVVSLKITIGGSRMKRATMPPKEPIAQPLPETRPISSGAAISGSNEL